MSPPPTKTCKYVDAAYIMPGWGCCQCHAYNGIQRAECKACGHTRCELAPDGVTGKRFEDRRHHLDYVGPS